MKINPVPVVVTITDFTQRTAFGLFDVIEISANGELLKTIHVELGVDGELLHTLPVEIGADGDWLDTIPVEISDADGKWLETVQVEIGADGTVYDAAIRAAGYVNFVWRH